MLHITKYGWSVTLQQIAEQWDTLASKPEVPNRAVTCRCPGALPSIQNQHLRQHRAPLPQRHPPRRPIPVLEWEEWFPPGGTVPVTSLSACLVSFVSTPGKISFLSTLELKLCDFPHQPSYMIDFTLKSCLKSEANSPLLTFVVIFTTIGSRLTCLKRNHMHEKKIS